MQELFALALAPVVASAQRTSVSQLVYQQINNLAVCDRERPFTSTVEAPSGTGDIPGTCSVVHR